MMVMADLTWAADFGCTGLSSYAATTTDLIWTADFAKMCSFLAWYVIISQQTQAKSQITLSSTYARVYHMRGPPSRPPCSAMPILSTNRQACRWIKSPTGPWNEMVLWFLSGFSRKFPDLEIWKKHWVEPVSPTGGWWCDTTRSTKFSSGLHSSRTHCCCLKQPLFTKLRVELWNCGIACEFTEQAKFQNRGIPLFPLIFSVPKARDAMTYTRVAALCSPT